MIVKRTYLLDIILGIIIVLPYIGIGGIFFWSQKEKLDIENATVVIISKQTLTLSVYDFKGNIKCEFPIACGKNLGNKNLVGDLKTPEGVFKVYSIEKSENWSHDFNDGNGQISGAYGPFFIRLQTPGHTGIGIHGTHDDKSIGSRITEGCIRLHNDNVLKLVKFIRIGTVVIITPSADDVVIKQEINKK